MPRFPITRAHPYTPERGAFAGRTFHTEHEYRTALARRKGFRSLSARQGSRPPATSTKAIRALRSSERVARARSLEAVAHMRRDGLSLSKAARRAGTTPATVKRHAAPALLQEGRRTRAKAGDRMVRQMTMVSPQGTVSVTVRGSRKATLVAEHAVAVRRFVETGDDSGLRRFEGASVSGIDFETDPDVITEWAQLGQIEFEDIYEVVS